MEEGQKGGRGPKWKRLHLDMSESVRLSQSEAGTFSLRQPLDRTHPQASTTDPAMAPRYRSRRFKPPRRVSSSINQAESSQESSVSAENGVDSGCRLSSSTSRESDSQGPTHGDSLSGEEEADCLLVANSDDGKECAKNRIGEMCRTRRSSSEMSDTHCVFQQPSTSRSRTKSVGYENGVNVFDDDRLSETCLQDVDVAGRLQNQNRGLVQKLEQKNSRERFDEWDDAEEEREMAEQSSDKAIHLLSVLGGFQPAASLQHQSNASTDASWNDSSLHMPSASQMASFPKPSYKYNKGHGKKKQWVIDSNQSSITKFMGNRNKQAPSVVTTSPASFSATNSDREGFQPQLSSDRQVFSSPSKVNSQKMSDDRNVPSTSTSSSAPLVSDDRIVYGSPSKMCSPVKKMSDSDNVYVISDDSSPERSQGKRNKCQSVDGCSSQAKSSVKKLFTFNSSNQNAAMTKKSKGATSSRTASRGVKRKNSKSNSKQGVADKHQRTLASTSSSTLGLSNIDFDTADDEDFLSIQLPTTVSASSSASVSASVPAVAVNVKVGKTFGLLNDSSVEMVRVNWFEVLPQELVQNILCTLPMVDLCLSVSRVCVAWNSIVSSPTFVPWKKLYHKLKKGDRECIDRLNSITQQEGMTTARLRNLISYMQGFKVVAPYNNASELLRQHPKYSWAVALLEDRAPHCIRNGEVNPWSLVCALVLVSATVEDIHCTLRLLTTAHCRLTSGEVLDLFYCINTFVLHWKTTSLQLAALQRDQGERGRGSQSVNVSESRATSVLRGLHYRLFYALYLWENSFMASTSMLQQAMSTCPGQQSMVKYSCGDSEVRLTHEQLRIINYTPSLRSGENVKVFAYAGTGKTTVLLRYTQMRPHLKFLMIVFNRSICEHAQRIFPPNVTCKTGHGLAFAVTGRRYAIQNQLNAGNLRVYDVAMAIKLRKKVKGNHYTHAKFVMEAVKNFLSSADDFVTSHHVPSFRVSGSGQVVTLTHDERMLCAENAEYYWSRMKDTKDSEVKMTHDGYLKLYQQSAPSLRGYDIILVDEAQDLSPALLDIIVNQSQPKLYVGDRHQQIYAFRGAVNAMDGMTAHKVFYLTKSFRFGPEIAQVANTLLENLKNETSQSIVGHGTPGSVSGCQVGQMAVLCRSNYTLFCEAVRVCSNTQPSVRIAFVGGLEGLGLSMLKDIYVLMLSPNDRKKENLHIQNPFIKSFRSVGDLERYATSIHDLELLSKLKVVRFFMHNLPQSIAKLSARAISNIQQADIVFSTAHKAKGLEFSTVRIMPDFLELDTLPMVQLMQRNHGRVERSVNEEEVNILYVAVTRAKHALIMSTGLRTMLVQMGGGCYQPMLTEHLQGEGVPMKCLSSGQPFRPHRITIFRPKLTVGNGVEVSSGVLSPAELCRVGSGYSSLFGDSTNTTTTNDDQAQDNNNAATDIDDGNYP